MVACIHWGSGNVSSSGKGTATQRNLFNRREELIESENDSHLQRPNNRKKATECTATNMQIQPHSEGKTPVPAVQHLGRHQKLLVIVLMFLGWRELGFRNDSTRRGGRLVCAWDWHAGRPVSQHNQLLFWFVLGSESWWSWPVPPEQHWGGTGYSQHVP